MEDLKTNLGCLPVHDVYISGWELDGGWSSQPPYGICNEGAWCIAGGPSDPPRQPLELWVAETATGKARRLLKSPEQGLSSIFDECVYSLTSF